MIRAELVVSPLMIGGAIYRQWGEHDSRCAACRRGRPCHDLGARALVMWLVPSIHMAIKWPDFTRLIFEHGFPQQEVPRGVS